MNCREMKEFRISLSDIRFHAFHGVFEQENRVGNEFSVSLSVRIPFDDAIDSDTLDATISYAELYEIVEKEMKKTRKLLETVASSIQKQICMKWPEITGGEITIYKSTPPIPSITGTAGVSLFF